MAWCLPIPERARALVAELYPVELPTPSARAMRDFLARRPVEAWMLRNGLSPFDGLLHYMAWNGCWKCDHPGCPNNALKAWREREGVDSDDGESDSEQWLG
jgi:hypothetical protein